jgi:Reverse transcriptase (RNA-dependent DNA polymerase)
VENMLVYLDDVMVFSRSSKFHLSHVAETLSILGNAGISLKLKKRNLFAETVDCLGHPSRATRCPKKEHFSFEVGSPISNTN